MRTTSSLSFCLLLCAVSLFAQVPADSSVVAESTVDSNASSVSFVMPAEGDVFYSSDVKIVAHVQGPVPPAMLAVLDGFALDKPIQVENGILTVELYDLAQGVHEFKLLFLDDHKHITLSQIVRFFIRVPEPRRDATKGKFRQFGSVKAQAEWKGEDAASRIMQQSEVLDIITFYDPVADEYFDSALTGKAEKPISKNLNAGTQVTYNFKDGRWEGYVSGLLSTDGSRFRQPVDRFSGSVTFGPWASIKGGDVYPSYNSMVLNGTRVRGTEVSAAVVTGDSAIHWAYVKATTGETRREVPAYVVRTEAPSESLGYRDDIIPGTLAQKLSAVRLGFGGGPTFDLGITVMKASDLRGDSLYEFINGDLYGVRPVENLVTGVDSRLGLWDGRIQIYGQWAISLYTQDRSLGAFNADTAGKSFNPKKYEDIFTINPTTSGWEYLLTGGGTKPDYKGFVDANSTYSMGFSTSIPFSSGLVYETDASYTHLGAEYHSEGNPFLGSNPGNGWDLQQRLALLENRLNLGLEGSNFEQDLGIYEQLQRSFKGEVRFSPGAYQPAVWLNGGVTAQIPRGNSPFQYTQDFDELNVGGFHQFKLGQGSLHLSTQYGYTYSKLTLETDTSSAALQNSPATQTHNVNTTFQYKFRGSNFQPKLSYTYSNNGVQKPTNNLILGIQDAFLEKRFRMDVNFLMGQYPKSVTKNDLSFGENLTLSYAIGDKQSVRCNERWSKYGTRTSITSGAYYEMFF